MDTRKAAEAKVKNARQMSMPTTPNITANRANPMGSLRRRGGSANKADFEEPAHAVPREIGSLAGTCQGENGTLKGLLLAAAAATAARVQIGGLKVPPRRN
jgi:hypothetical protein